MRVRLAPVLVLLLIVTACAPAAAPDPEPAVDAGPTDDEAAVDAVRAAYVEHYNLGHADMVADLYTEDALTLFADGGVSMGREAIQAALEAALTGGPTASIESGGIVVMGDQAVSRGSYAIEIAAEGEEPVSLNGHFMTGFERVDGEWKISVVLTNFDAPPAPGAQSIPGPADAPEEITEGPLAALATSYAEHFNMGHPGVVAAMYADDAVVAFADQPLDEGTEAIEASLAARADGVNQLVIHTVGSEDMGDGWTFGGGWYEVTTPTDDGEVSQVGSWLGLASTDADGTTKFKWAISNVRHGDM